ncbi:hypothetical protein HN865_02805 [Candidatus Woesearchaeota archaeon]|mgnify:FL=1|nr:hypothetical protein [Candidatus Woesearchaeota archaeon]MBT7237766.1 hypothetical protein [Candidatus Woesearchaeota archaeon]
MKDKKYIFKDKDIFKFKSFYILMSEKQQKNKLEINLTEHPLEKLMRASMLEIEAKKEESDLSCTTCKVNLPYRHPFVGRNEEGKINYYCSLCDEYFEI